MKRPPYRKKKSTSGWGKGQSRPRMLAGVWKIEQSSLSDSKGYVGHGGEKAMRGQQGEGGLFSILHWGGAIRVFENHNQKKRFGTEVGGKGGFGKGST